MRKMLAGYINNQVMEAVAAEHKKGYRLYIGSSTRSSGPRALSNAAQPVKNFTKETKS